jgi:hypothetical protein
MDMKKIHTIDAMMVVGTLLIILGIVGYAGYVNPLVIAPSDDYATSNTSVLFSFEKAGSILIDDNIEFTSPEKINAENNLVVRLKPGTYYWKVEGKSRSETRKLTIISEVGLKLKDNGKDLYEVVNSGNTLLNVEVYDNETLIEKITLKADESRNSSGTKFIGGEQDE